MSKSEVKSEQSKHKARKIYSDIPYAVITHLFRKE
jgi:hypothetical protein